MIVSLEEMKQYLRVDFEDDDAIITALITGAEKLCADILRALTSEDEVTAEFALAHFWIYLANLKLILPLTTGEGGYKALADSVDVVLVYAGLNLIVAEVIQLAYLLARTDALA